MYVRTITTDCRSCVGNWTDHVILVEIEILDNALYFYASIIKTNKIPKRKKWHNWKDQKLQDE